MTIKAYFLLTKPLKVSTREGTHPDCTDLDSWSLILSVPGAALTHETVRWPVEFDNPEANPNKNLIMRQASFSTVRVIKSTALGQGLALEPLSVLL